MNQKKDELREIIRSLKEEEGLTMPEIGRHFMVTNLNNGVDMVRQHVYYYLQDHDNEEDEEDY